jgi:hypothetical protein
VAAGCGFVLSIGKDGVSRQIAIFCEDHMVLDTTKGKVSYLDTIKYRLYTETASSAHKGLIPVVGRGKAVGIQLSYINQHWLKMRWYHAFLRINSGILNPIRKTKIPWFLPESLGGLSIPCMKEDIPEWGIKYINYIFRVLDLGFKERIIVLCSLQNIIGDLSHGLVQDAGGIDRLSKLMDNVSLASPEEVLSMRTDKIWPEQAIRQFLSGEGYPSLEWDSLIRISREYGFVPVKEALDLFNRVVNTNKLIEGTLFPLQHGVTRWNRRSSRYWKKFQLVDESQLDPRFKDFPTLHKLAMQSFAYYVPVQAVNQTLRFGTSLSMFRPLPVGSPIIRRSPGPDEGA